MRNFLKKLLLSAALIGAAAPAFAWGPVASRVIPATAAAASGTGKSMTVLRLSPGTWICDAQLNVAAATTTTLLTASFSKTAATVATTDPGYTVVQGGSAALASGINVGSFIMEVLPVNPAVAASYDFNVNVAWTGTGGPPNVTGNAFCYQVN